MPAKPDEFIRPEDILTPDVLHNLELVFGQSRLSIREVYVRSEEPQWRLFPFSSQSGGKTNDEFCRHVRAQDPFARICADERIAFCNDVIAHAGSPVLRVCPFGLVALGFGLQIGRVEIVLRGDSWLERGTEGQAIHATLKTIHSLGETTGRDDLLSLLKHQQTHTGAEVQAHGEVLKGLLGLVRLQAVAEYQNRLTRSREEFIQRLSGMVYPLMAVNAEEDHTHELSAAVESVRAFLGVRSCTFLFGRGEAEDPLVNIAAHSEGARLIDSRKAHQLLFAGDQHQVGVDHILAVKELHEVTQEPARACRIAYPEGNAAALVVSPGIADAGGIGDQVLARVLRTLSVPVCVSALETGLQREARLRRLQARNTLHTMRSTFQAVVGDVEYIRQTVGDTISPVPGEVEESLAHMEELVGFMSALLKSQDYILELQSQGDQRRTRLGEKTSTALAAIVDRAKQSFKTRSHHFSLEIKVDPTVSQLPAVLIDEGAISLVFIHLLHNALKYSHQGGGRKRTIDVTGRQDFAFVYVDVADYGVGIHPFETDRIFEPLVQGSVEDKTRAITGQGLGLAAARNIARLHGGYVRLKTCIAYDRQGSEIPRDRIARYLPGSEDASALLQHCLVVFEVSLPR